MILPKVLSCFSLNLLNQFEGFRIAQVFVHGFFHFLNLLVQVHLVFLKLFELLKSQLE